MQVLDPLSEERLTLSQEGLLAFGAKRDVYRHPNDENLLVKVFRRELLDRYAAKKFPWYRPSRRLRHLAPTLRELREQLSVLAKLGAYPRHLQRIVGFAETDHGLGEIVERKPGRMTFLAPTLKTLLRTGRYSDEAQAALDEFLQWLLDSEIVISDLHPSNLVYAADEDGSQYFAMVDGLGEVSFIPLKSLSIQLNRRHKLHKIDRLDEQIEGLLRQSRETIDSGRELEPPYGSMARCRTVFASLVHSRASSPGRQSCSM